MIPSKLFKDIIKYLYSNIDYSKLSSDDYSKLVNDIKSINKKYDINIDPYQIIYIRDTFIYLLSKTKGTYAHRIGEYIFLEYNNNVNIINIAHKYNIPPIDIVHQILIELKHESHDIEKIIKEKKLPKDIQKQMSLINKYNPNTWFDVKVPKLTEKINKLNSNYKTKKDLKKHGKCPDILFDSECLYKDNKKIKWIVFRPYILFDCDLHIRDIQKIVNNFNRFGNGLILYNDILCSKSFIKKINTYIDTFINF